METTIPKLKIVLLGNSGVGKSSIINQYVFKKFQKGIVDFPQALSTQLEIDGNNVILQILDTNGQERHGGPGLEATFFNDAKGCMLVYDVNDSKTFDNLENWHNEFILRVISDQSDWTSFPFILLGNKDDINGDKTKEFSERAWKRCQNGERIYHLFTSAKENKNLSEAFHYISKAALKKEAEKSTRERQTDHSKPSEQEPTTMPSLNKRRIPSFKGNSQSHAPNVLDAKNLESDNITKVQNGNSRNNIPPSQGPTSQATSHTAEDSKCPCTIV